MRFTSTDPDIETLYRRISEDLLDLQPDFQRGEVWGRSKQQKLIDSILREWHVPPIHVIKHDDSHIQEVLDGKQRLTAICDFMNNEFPVDGFIEPVSNEIRELDGKRYNELPPKVRETFKRFPIRQFLIDNFAPEEPGELFFRLNSPTYLTAAEQRNAFFGEPRKQIKKLVSVMEEFGVEKGFIGFSNSRMAYDDVLARVCFVFEISTLHKRISSRELSDRYRISEPFSENLMDQLEIAIRGFGEAKGLSEDIFRFNKATLFSWFVFLLVAQRKFGFNVDAQIQAKMLSKLDELRSSKVNEKTQQDAEKNSVDYFLSDLFSVFEDRSRARVGNVDSVLIRDIMLWLVFLLITGNTFGDESLENILSNFNVLILKKSPSSSAAEKFFYDVIENQNWGSQL